MEKPIEINKRQVDAEAELIAKVLITHAMYVRSQKNKKDIEIKHGKPS